MKVRVSINDITAVKADAVIITSFEGGITRGSATRSVNKMLGGVISELQEYGEVKGKLNEINIIHSLGKMPARVIALAGLGKSAEMNLEKFRNVMGQACRQLAKLQCKRIAAIVYGTGIHGLSREEIAQAIVEGAFLGTYKFSKYLTQEHDNGEVEELILVEKDKVNLQSLEQACARGRIMAEATNLARDMVNEPANYMTPSDMARVAKGIARKHKLGIKILESSEMQDLGMGALLGVAQGSLQPPKFIVMSYRGDARSSRSIAYIGKGITFDSGGISLKPSENMHEMKGDMSGGAAVIAALSAISRMGLRVNITAIIAATENLPSGKALKPGDILKAMNGKTIEVVNTDAEGRLTLADALSYAVAEKCVVLLDVATLTGACQVALGDVCSGAFTNNEKLLNRLVQAGERAGECLWQLPMKDEYRELNKSEVADIKNAGGRYGGAITAAMFLSEFVGDTPWVHVDIAGTAMSDKEKGCKVKGATGVMVRTLVLLAESYAKG